MNKLFVITGASGAGKTTAVKNVEQIQGEDLHFCYFDNVGVPSNEEMIAKYGGGEGWQKTTTEIWIEKIIREYLPTKSTILDGQIRLSFIIEACQKFCLENYEIVLFDCSDEARKERLISRGHTELADANMMNWAKFLREEAKKCGATIIDNTSFTQEESRGELLKILGF